MQWAVLPYTLRVIVSWLCYILICLVKKQKIYEISSLQFCYIKFLQNKIRNSDLRKVTMKIRRQYEDKTRQDKARQDKTMAAVLYHINISVLHSRPKSVQSDMHVTSQIQGFLSVTQ
jgi:hypothetical protein